MTTDRAGPAPHDRRWQALAVCLTAAFMTLLDTSIVNVALPSVEHGLGASPAELSWVMSGYALTLGLTLVPAGRLGDMRGRRQTFLTGLALFTLASAACGLSTGAAWLVLFRLVQGASAGLIAPQTSALIQQMFQGAERARAFGMMGSTIGISTAVGPLAGGLLIQAVGGPDAWRWVFYVNLPIGAAAFCAALRLLPRSPRSPGRREYFDVPGVVLLGSGVLALLLPLVQEQQWQGRLKWALLPVGAGLLAAFWAWERRQGRRDRAPLVDLRLFSLRSFSLGVLLSLVYFGGFTTLFFVYTLFLQNGMGYGALAAGLSSMPFAAGSAAGAAVGGRLVVRFGRRLVIAGLCTVAAGMLGVVAAVHWVPGRGVAWAAAVPLLLAGIGSGLTISPNTTLTLSLVPVRRGGAAGGVLQTAQRIGSAAGVAVVGSVYFARLATHGSPATALQYGLLTSVGIILLALCLAFADLRERRAHAQPQQPRETARERV
ncbi:EmrB/QacA subfamily drug resistance transporter [Streptomyces puniciscabiei]|uniref:EmrB/QacA subfamily drug resistance transporter n=1 Tax=Streptomyces puniciscabiei TaxID=164348 RepID=A0A542UP62_9ACTN|nr:MFS transporter [Streptomyces puniciscabiei]TQL00870.1 EmrB/QacA subfamily drug resistance transporter [Streptomyces puniciscabiei]